MYLSKKRNYSTRVKLLAFVPLFLLLVAVLWQYEVVCNFGGTLSNPASLKTFVDAWIPFNIYIIYPYLLCLWYLPFSGILFAFNRRMSVIQVVSFYLSAILIWASCYVVYLIFPTTAQGVMISSFDPLVLNMGMFQALQSLYTASTPLGDFPSLHVAPLVFMGLFLYKQWRSFFWLFLPFAFFGAAGTVLLKFHTLAGLLGGAAMGVFGYYVLYERVVLPYLTKTFLKRG